jgi:hypothetical protein
VKILKCGEAATDNSAFRIPNYALERSDKLQFTQFIVRKRIMPAGFPFVCAVSIPPRAQKAPV